jgi:hypothetical protein
VTSACIVLSLSVTGLAGYALVLGLQERRTKRLIRDRRVIEDAAHDQFLADVGLSRKDLR